MPLKILRKVYSYGVIAVLITGSFTIIEMENSDRKQMFVHLKSYKYINHRQTSSTMGNSVRFIIVTHTVCLFLNFLRRGTNVRRIRLLYCFTIHQYHTNT